MFEVAYTKTQAISQLQQQIIEALEPLRSGLRQKDPVGHVLKDWLPTTTGETRQNLERWGYDEIGGLFRPHITLTRFKKRAQQVDIATLPPLAEFSGIFTVLALCKMGEHGTCNQLIAPRFFLSQ